MNLLLTSAGLTTNAIIQAFLKLLNNQPENAHLAYIPTAAYSKGQDPNFIHKTRGQLRSLGITNIVDLDLQQHTFTTLKQKLSYANTIFVDGGNTYFLLYWLRASGFFEVLQELKFESKTYIGVSAGSIIAGPDIQICQLKNLDANYLNLTDLSALNLVDFAIFPHHEPKWEQDLKHFQKNYPHHIYPITNDQALLQKNTHQPVII